MIDSMDNPDLICEKKYAPVSFSPLTYGTLPRAGPVATRNCSSQISARTTPGITVYFIVFHHFYHFLPDSSQGQTRLPPGYLCTIGQIGYLRGFSEARPGFSACFQRFYRRISLPALYYNQTGIGKRFFRGFVNGQSSDFVDFGLFQEYNSAQFSGQPLRHVLFARPRG